MSKVPDLTLKIVFEKEGFSFCFKSGLIFKVLNSMCFLYDLSRLSDNRYLKAVSTTFLFTYCFHCNLYVFEFLFLLDLFHCLLCFDLLDQKITFSVVCFKYPHRLILSLNPCFHSICILGTFISSS